MESQPCAVLFIIFILCNAILCIRSETEAYTQNESDNINVPRKLLPEVINNKADREGRDLVYEAMKMRTGVWPSQDHDAYKIVGGGLVEKQLLSSPVFSHARENPEIAIRLESRGKKYFYF